MRQLGTLATQQEAKTFEDFLLTRGIKSRAEAANGQWLIWVYDEDHLSEAREQLAEFRGNPQAERYREAVKSAEAMRDDAIKKAVQARKSIVEVRRQWERPSLASAPATVVLLLLSIAVTGAASSFQSGWKLADNESIVQALTIAPYQLRGNMVAWEGLEAVKSGEIWRLVTPIFIHFDPLHILFNMLMLVSLGTMIEVRAGSLRYSLLVLVIAVVSNLGQYWWANPMFGGMSGVNYGLFGYAWMMSRFSPGSGFYIHPSTVYWLMGWFVLCIMGAVGPVANAAHAFGLFTGLAIGYAPALIRAIRR